MAKPKPKTPSAAPVAPVRTAPATTPVRFWGISLLTLRLGLFALAALLYFNTIGNDYALDDYLVTGPESIAAKGLAATGEIFTTNYVNDTLRGLQVDYRPLVKFSFAAEQDLLGGNVHISHFINALLYGGVVLVLFNVLLSLLQGYSLLLPVLATALFAVHPVHTEVVASLKNRDELLALLFGLLSLRAAWRWFAVPDGTPQPPRHLAWAVGFYLLALLSKPLNSMLYVGIVPLSLYVLGTQVPQALALRRAGLVLLALLAVTGAFFGAVLSMLPTYLRPFEYIENPLAQLNDFGLTVGTGMMGLLKYAQLLVWPWPLSSYYGYDTIPVVGLGSPTVWAVLAVHLVLLLVGLWGLARRNLWGWGALCYVGVMALYSNIPYPAAGIVAERSLLVASMPFCVALAYGLMWLTRTPLRPEQGRGLQLTGLRYTPAVVALAAALLLAGTAATVARNRHWKDHVTLYSTDLKTEPRSFWLRSLMAKEYSVQYKELPEGSPERQKIARQALEQLRQAIALYPDFYDVHLEAGIIYARELNQLDSAEYYFRQAIRTVGTSPTPFQNMGYLFTMKNKPDSAVHYYRIALQRDSTNLDYHHRVIYLSVVARDLDGAWQATRRFEKLQPQSPWVPYYYGSILVVRGDSASAMTYYEQALARDPNNPQLCQDLAAYYARHNNPDKAAKYKKMAAGAPAQPSGGFGATPGNKPGF